MPFHFPRFIIKGPLILGSHTNPETFRTHERSPLSDIPLKYLPHSSTLPSLFFLLRQLGPGSIILHLKLVDLNGFVALTSAPIQTPLYTVASDLPKISIYVQLMFCFKMVDWVYLLNYLSPTPVSKSSGLRKHRTKHIFSSVENGKWGRYIHSRDFYKLLEDCKGDGIVLRDKPERKVTQVRKAAGKAGMLLVWSPPQWLWDRRQQARILIEDNSPEKTLVLTSLCLVLSQIRCSAWTFICKYGRMTRGHQRAEAVQ